MPLKVIGAGFGRTATTSLKLALEQLGLGPCHHMYEVAENPQQIDWFSKAGRGEPVNWGEVFGNFGAACDWPSAAYYKELADHFPDAKIVLTVRDPEKWYDSVATTIYPASANPPGWLKVAKPQLWQFFQMTNDIVWQGVFGGQFENRAKAIEIFKNHIQEVKAAIPPERLLIHQAEDGWDPLCALLGKPVPDTPYPRVNEAASMNGLVSRMTWMRRAPWLLAGIAAALLLGLLAL